MLFIDQVTRLLCFDQLSDACTPESWLKHFVCHFQTIFSHQISTTVGWKEETKKGRWGVDSQSLSTFLPFCLFHCEKKNNGPKTAKNIPGFRCESTQKLVKIHNTGLVNNSDTFYNHKTRKCESLQTLVVQNNRKSTRHITVCDSKLKSHIESFSALRLKI